jgi:phage terminase large subunit-like protein
MDQGRAMFCGRHSLAEEEIADLFSDKLSDVPSLTSSGSDIVSGNDRGEHKCGPYQ